MVTAVSAVFFTICPVVASADQMVLTTLGSGLQLQGQFLGFEGHAYIIDINGTRMHVPATLVTCEGVDCLDFQPAAIVDTNS
jgi:hypothetical protein